MSSRSATSAGSASLLSMRPIAMSIIVFLGGFIVMVPEATARSGHRVPPRCPGPHETVVTADVQAVVFQAPQGAAGPTSIIACAYGTRRSYDLGVAPYGGPSGSGGVSPIVLAGAVVAYGLGESSDLPEPNGSSVREIWVRNLRTGRLIHRIANGLPARPGHIGAGVTMAIVVKTDGSVAWIVRTGDGLDDLQVRSVDKTGEHVLASSPEVEPESLALAASTVYWSEGGRPFSAQLH